MASDGRMSYTGEMTTVREMGRWCAHGGGIRNVALRISTPFPLTMFPTAQLASRLPDGPLPAGFMDAWGDSGEQCVSVGPVVTGT